MQSTLDRKKNNAKRNEGPYSPKSSSVQNPAPEGRVLRVLVADDHQIFRHALVKLLGSQPDFLVVGQASDGVEAIELANRLRPEIIIMDISMPNMNGIDATGQIHAEMPDLRIIGLSMHDSSAMVQGFMAAGGDAYINKTVLTDNLFNAIRGVSP